MLSIKAKELFFTLADYKTLKNTILNFLEFLFQKREMCSFPQIIDIVITKKCNLDCIFCKKYNSDSEEMSLDEFKFIAAQSLTYARKLNVCSGGEPFCHKNLIDILRTAKKHKVWISVVSNGALLTKKATNIIVREKLIDSLAFSVDGIKAKTVERIRINSSLEKIIRNIDMLKIIKKTYKRKKPYINIRYALMKENIEELPEAVSFWGNFGISSMQCNYLSLHDGINKNQSLLFHQNITNKSFRDALENKKRFPKMYLSLPPIIGHDKNNYLKNRCAYPWMFAMIDADGRVFPDYHSWGTLDMGNILNGKESFKKIWNGLSYNYLRRSVNKENTKKFYSYCSICPIKNGFGSESLHFGDEMLFENLSSKEKASFLLHAGRHSQRINR